MRDGFRARLGAWWDRTIEQHPWRILGGTLLAMVLAWCLFALVGCTPRDAAAKPGPRLAAVSVTVADTNLWVRLSWTLPTQPTGGAIDGLLDSAGVSSGGLPQIQGHILTAAARADSFRFTRPAPGVTVSGFACVQSVRRGLASAKACRSWTYTEADVPPIPPVLDSIRIAGLDVKPDSVELAYGETQQFCAVLRFASGHSAVRTKDLAVGCGGWLASPGIVAATPAEQAMADTTCLQWSATGGTISAETCGTLGFRLAPSPVRS